MKRFLVSFFTLFLALNLGIEVAKFFSGAAHKGYNAEARQYISSLNKSQAAYYTEEGTFSNSFNDLQVGIRTKTKLYEYSIQATKNAALSYAIPRDDAYEKVYFGVFQ
ncbi:type IV pilin-like G/H family protein [Floridanema aerugineum]|uniref:Type IV pilin-like G/H family protein n=1 Tax=Floridaenema aerugineum BLCC-F46 TaxID=3153654 RepID=A0ABV4XHQ9_9CYAN